MIGAQSKRYGSQNEVEGLGDVTSLLRKMAGKVDALESILGELSHSRFPSIEEQLTKLHMVLTKRRKDHLTVEEVAELTGRSAYTVRRWIKEKVLHAVRLDEGGPRGKLLIPHTEIERLIAEGKGAHVPDGAVR